MAAPVFLSAAWLYYPYCNDGPTLCLWKRFFNFECLGCGLTRAACLLSRGFYDDAIAMNWGVVPFFLVIVTFSLIAMKTLLDRMKHRKEKKA